VAAAARAGECAAVLGLSGSGKSNLLGFLANRTLGQGNNPPGVLVDCNRLAEPTTAAFYCLVLDALAAAGETPPTLAGLESALQPRLESDRQRLCLLFDRFDGLPAALSAAIAGGLRAARDAHKYALTYVIASRCALDPGSELSELFFANTLWLGPLSESDARWSVEQFARRRGLAWDEDDVRQMIDLSGGYPSLLRGVNEAYAAGTPLAVEALSQHPALRQRLDEFWADDPSPAALAASRLAHIPLLRQSPAAPSELTSKEQLLLAYFQAHPAQVCEKDDLIRAVWPEDRVFQRGVRDDSLAQLVRRLREKIESDPSQPRLVKAVPGRGYRYK